MNKLARNTLALGTATLIVTAGLSFSANGADKVVAQAEASAITATGVTGIIDSKVCTVTSTGPATPQGNGICGTGLSVSNGAVGAIDQNASTGLNGTNGTSTASSRVASVSIPALTKLDVSGVQASLGAINTGTILDDIVKGLDPVVTGPLFTTLLTPLLTAIQNAAIAPITTALQANLPVNVEIGAVSSKCELPSATPMTSSVAGINVRVTLPAPVGDIVVPVALNTTPNAALIGPAAPQQLVDGVLDGLEASLNTSLNGVLGPLAAVVGTVQQQLVDAILAQLGPALLAPLGNALKPVLDGTVNKQVTNPDGSVEVTALDLKVLGTTATAAIARSKCGPNSAVVVTTPPPTKTTPTPTKSTPTKDSDDSDSQADSDADGTTPVNNVDDSDTIADADAQADADVTTTLPSTGAPNLLPFWLLGIALLLFGGAVLLNEKRRLNQI